MTYDNKKVLKYRKYNITCHFAYCSLKHHAYCRRKTSAAVWLSFSHYYWSQFYKPLNTIIENVRLLLNVKSVTWCNDIICHMMQFIQHSCNRCSVCEYYQMTKRLASSSIPTGRGEWVVTTPHVTGHKKQVYYQQFDSFPVPTPSLPWKWKWTHVNYP